MMQNPDYILRVANSHIQELRAEAADYRQVRETRRAGRVRSLVARTLIAAGESLAA
jgi:hypothetical protein